MFRLTSLGKRLRNGGVFKKNRSSESKSLPKSVSPDGLAHTFHTYLFKDILDTIK